MMSELFQLENTIREKLHDFFPKELTSKLLTGEQMKHVKPEEKIHYKLTSHDGTGPIPGSIDETTIRDNFTSLCDANMALLEHFFEKHRAKIAAAPKEGHGIKDPVFANAPMEFFPQEKGEPGWAYDNGCLSLLTADVVDNQRVVDLLIVEKVKEA
jgi:hypothetical protein